MFLITPPPLSPSVFLAKSKSLPFTLNVIESSILTTLLLTAATLSPPPTVRIAGGWVRDKLLDLPNDDLDVALSTTTGLAFAEAVNKLLQASDPDPDSKPTKIAVIQANPDQSKHLETATMRISGLSIDFVNLRSEEYAVDSRIPTIAFGTPTEDALRRDFTLNALFFNVSTCEIEDFTNKGVADLKAKILRTPLDPLVTFLDDPLRVLRGVRFSARFGLEIEAEAMKAASTLEVSKRSERAL